MHLFINWATTRTVWNKLLGGFGLQLQGNMNIENWVLTRSVGRKSRTGKLIWDVLVHTVAWVMWLERNQRIFEDKSKPIEKVCLDAVRWRWVWIKLDPIVRGLKKSVTCISLGCCN